MMILEDIAGKIPYAVNAFNNSFTKKRFLMMKNGVTIRYRYLRRIAILPFFVIVFALFSFTTGEAEIIYVDKQETVEYGLKTASISVLDNTESDIFNDKSEFSDLSLLHDSIQNMHYIMQQKDSMLKYGYLEIAKLYDFMNNIISMQSLNIPDSANIIHDGIVVLQESMSSSSDMSLRHDSLKNIYGSSEKSDQTIINDFRDSIVNIAHDQIIALRDSLINSSDMSYKHYSLKNIQGSFVSSDRINVNKLRDSIVNITHDQIIALRDSLINHYDM